MESVLVTDYKTGLRFVCGAPEVPFLGTQKWLKSNFWVTKKMVLLVLNATTTPVLESVTKTDFKTCFGLKIWSFFRNFANFGSFWILDYIINYDTEFVTDQESSIYKFVCGTLVISVFV